MTMRIGRRLLGVLMLVCGVLIAVVMPKILSPGIVGLAGRAPAPGPPPVGACVLWPTNDVVDCSLPHTSEVVRTWEADDPTRTDPRRSCLADLDAYLGLRPTDILPGWYFPSADWSESSVPAAEVFLEAPRGQRLGDQGWSACAISTADPPQTTTARLADLIIPAGTGWCFPELGTADDIQVHIPCTQAHRLELVGNLTLITGTNDEMRWGQIAVSELPPESAVRAECQGIAVDLFENADPTFGGHVEIASFYEVGRADFSGDDDGAMMLTAGCYALSPPGQMLTGSLVGIGDNPLPIE